MKVFIVDDSRIVYGRLVTLLHELKDIEVIGHAQHARDAIASIQRLNPEVVILDIRMPGGNGIDVLHHIKHDHPSAFVIILTNAHHPQYQKKCLEAGADFFFDKSIEFHKVAEVLRQRMRGSHRYASSESESE